MNAEFPRLHKNLLVRADAVCCTHLLRELNALIETKKHEWACEMKKLLLEMKKIV